MILTLPPQLISALDESGLDVPWAEGAAHRGVDASRAPALVRELRGRLREPSTLRALLRGAHFERAPPPPAAPAETRARDELEARREALRRREAEREYRRMTRNVAPASSAPRPIDSFGAAWKQASIGVNVIVAMFTMFLVGYVAGHGVSSKLEHRLLCGLAAAIVIMIVEMVLFVIRNEEAERRAKAHAAGGSRETRRRAAGRRSDAPPVVAEPAAAVETMPPEESGAARRRPGAS